MSSIDRLQRVSTLTTADLVALFSNTLGDDTAATLGTLLAFLQQQLSAAGALITQYAAPNLTGFTVLVAPLIAGQSVYLLLTPTAGFAAGTITLPPQASCVDGQTLLVSTTQLVTALTVAGNGATAVNGAPTTLAANAFFRMRYDGPSKSWYRVG
jgi:hypothetical protein